MNDRLSRRTSAIYLKLVLGIGIVGAAAILTFGVDRRMRAHEGDLLVNFLRRVEPGKTTLAELKTLETSFVSEACVQTQCQRTYRIGPLLTEKLRGGAAAKNPLTEATVIVKNGVTEGFELKAYAGQLTFVSQRTNLDAPYTLSVSPPLVEQHLGRGASKTEVDAAIGVRWESLIALRTGQVNAEGQVSQILPNLKLPHTSNSK